MKTPRFAYLSSQDPANKRVWSGTHYSIYKALQQVGEVDVLGPYEPAFRLFICRVINQLSLKLLHKRISYRHSVFVSKGYAAFFNKKLKTGKYDFIIAPAASCELAFIQTSIPIIYITDGTFAGCLNYHKSLTNLTTGSIAQGNLIEQQAISKSRQIIVSSVWAANSALRDYNCPAQKIHILPYGANFERLPATDDLDTSLPVTWKLLFAGVYWEDKGGEFAFNAFKILMDKGYNVELTILGCEPPEHVQHPKLKKIPFIDKNSDEGQKKLYAIFKEHHLMLLPTRFDCTPIVINEASAFGIPCIASRTGGVEGHLQDGVNGFLVDYEDKGPGYAAKIEQLILSPQKYIELRKSTRKAYEDKLNWEKWRDGLKRILGLNA